MIAWFSVGFNMIISFVQYLSVTKEEKKVNFSII